MTQGVTILGLSKQLLDSTMAPDGEVGRWYGSDDGTAFCTEQSNKDSSLGIKSPAHLSSLPHLNHTKETSRL